MFPVPARTSIATPRALFDDAHARLAGWVRARFATRLAMAHQHLIDDLAQRTWVAVWQALDSGTYDPSRSALSTFIYAVSENIWRQHAKTASREAARGQGRLDADADLPGLTVEPAQAVQLAEGLELVRACLGGAGVGAGAGGAALTPDEVQMLQLLSRGVTDRALAEHLKIAPSTAHARKRAALDKVRKALESRVAGPEKGPETASIKATIPVGPVGPERPGTPGESPRGARP